MANFLSKFLFGNKPKIKQMPNFAQDQEQLINELVMQARQGNQQAMEYLQSILSDEEGAFDDFERPYMEQFQEQTIPSILERLNERGGMNKYSGSITQQLAQAGKGLSTNLAAQRANLKQNAIGQLQNYSQMGLTKKTSPYLQGGNEGFLSMLSNSPGASDYAGSKVKKLLDRFI